MHTISYVYYFLSHCVVLLMISRRTVAILEATLSSENGFEVRYRLTNNGDNIARYIPWDTPLSKLQGVSVNNPFDILDENDVLMEFQGAYAKHVQPSDEYALPLEAGEHVEELVDLAMSYKFLSTGVFTVTARNPVGSEMPRTPPIEIQIEELPSQDPQEILAAREINERSNFEVNSAVGCVPVSFVSCTAARQALINEAYSSLPTYVPMVPCWNDDNPGDDLSNMWFGDNGLNMGTVREQYHKLLDLACQTGDFTAGSVADCRCTDAGVYAWVNPGSSAHTVNLCPLFWTTVSLGKDSRMGTMVHEMSHFVDIADTDDHGYGCTDSLSFASSAAATARNNAENFEYYVERNCGSPNPIFCPVDVPTWIADQWCNIDVGYNTEICEWDGGDCCEETCTGTGCGQNGYDCQDPAIVDPCFGITCPEDACHTGTCTDGTCSNPNKDDGTACNDGDDTTENDRCVGGTCTGDVAGYDPESGYYYGLFTRIYNVLTFGACATECANAGSSCVHMSYRAASYECRVFASTTGKSGSNSFWERDIGIDPITLVGYYSGVFIPTDASSFDDCLAQCGDSCAQVSYRGASNTDGCRMFANPSGYHPNGWWKSDIMPCTSTVGYYGGVMVRVYNIASFELCCAECSMKASCIHISYKASGECRLFDTTTDFTVHSKWTSDEQTDCPTSKHIWNGVSSELVTDVTSAQDCCDTCTADEDCSHWSWRYGFNYCVMFDSTAVAASSNQWRSDPDLSDFVAPSTLGGNELPDQVLTDNEIGSSSSSNSVGTPSGSNDVGVTGENVSSVDTAAADSKDNTQSEIIPLS